MLLVSHGNCLHPTHWTYRIHGTRRFEPAEVAGASPTASVLGGPRGPGQADADVSVVTAGAGARRLRRAGALQREHRGQLGISPQTVKNHFTNRSRSLGAIPTCAVVLALQNGWIDLDQFG